MGALTGHQVSAPLAVGWLRHFRSGEIDMKASALLATILFGAVSIASATPLCAIGGTMDSYVTLGSGGCTVGDLLFSNFVYNDSGSAPGSAVFLTPISSSPTHSDRKSTRLNSSHLGI